MLLQELTQTTRRNQNSLKPLMGPDSREEIEKIEQKLDFTRCCNRSWKACFISQENVSPAMIRMLLYAGIDVYATGCLQERPLYRAAGSQIPCEGEELRGMIELLLQAGSDIEVANIVGENSIESGT